MPKVKASLSDNKRMEEMQKLVNPEEEPESPSDSRKIPDLKNLILLGKLTEKVNIGGFLFTISTLSAQENDLEGLIDSDRMDRAVNMVTGGTFEFNDSVISPPVRNMSESVFNNWMQDVDNSYLDTLGDLHGTTSNKIKKGLENGDFHLVTAGRNSYRIVSSHGEVVYNTNGTPFVFKYDSEAITKTERKAIRLHEGKAGETHAQPG